MRGIQYAAASPRSTTISGILDRPIIPDQVGDRRRAKTTESVTVVQQSTAFELIFAMDMLIQPAHCRHEIPILAA
jgi:hypothetical protein